MIVKEGGHVLVSCVQSKKVQSGFANQTPLCGHGLFDFLNDKNQKDFEEDS